MRNLAARAGLTGAVVINTCAVTSESERQARQAIRRARRDNPDATIVVTGCAAQINAEAFAAMPEVDHVVGNADKLRPATFERIADARRDGGAAMPRVVVNDIMSVRETAVILPEITWWKVSRAARAPSSRCSRAATTAAPSASSRSGAGRRARRR